jgi:hypothetical protein
MADNPWASEDLDIRKAIRDEKLVVKNGKHIYYGEEANKKAKESSEPISGLLVMDMKHFQWEEFAQRYQLEATGG